MKKRSMHRLHIESDIWKWYVKGQRKGIVVFAPTGKRYEVALEDYIRQSAKSPDTYASDRNGWGIQAMIDDMAYTVTPGTLKEYILRNLKNQDASWALCRG